MNVKLTLNLDAKVIEMAKKYALEKGVSLSEVVEEYLKKLTPSKQVITRNTKDFKPSTIPVLTPTQFLLSIQL